MRMVLVKLYNRKANNFNQKLQLSDTVLEKYKWYEADPTVNYGVG